MPLAFAILVWLPLSDLAWLPDGQYLGGSSQGNDLGFMFLPWWRFVLDSLAGGEFPLWNPYLSSGMPFVANPQPALFYPPVWMITFINLGRAVGVLYLVHLWLAAWGMYLWLRSEGTTISGAVLGAGTFTFSGYFFVRLYAGHTGVVMTQAWLPWILWASRKVLSAGEGRRKWAILGGIPVSLSLLAGHTASFFYVGLVWGAYVLYALCYKQTFNLKRLGQSLLPFILMGGIGIGLAAVQLFPTLEFLRYSTRQGDSYAFASNYAWSPGYWLTLLVPGFFGNPAQTGYWGDGVYEELIFYVGILPLVFCLVLGPELKHRLLPLLAGIAGVALLLALGPATVLHRLLYNLLPVFRVARAPARSGFMFTFAIAALTGLVVSHWRGDAPDLEPGRWRPAFLGVVAMTVVVILSGFILFTLQRDTNSQVGRLWHMANYSSIFLLFFVLAAGLLAAWAGKRLSGQAASVLAILLVLLDLWSYGRTLLQPVAITQSDYWQSVAEIASPSERVLPWGLNIFEQNQGLELDVRSVFAYDPLEINSYNRLTSFIADPRARAYDVLGARYLVSGQELAFDEAAPQLVSQSGGAWIYERATAYPPAWLVHKVEVYAYEEDLLKRFNEPDFDPAQTALFSREVPCDLAPGTGESQVEVTAYKNNSLELSVTADGDGILVLSEVAYPGWRAFIDGQRVPVWQADLALRAICMPAGEHTVTFSFLPISLIVGGVVSLLSWGFVVISCWHKRGGTS